MRTFHAGQLVTVVGEDGQHDGIVVHVPSLVKVEVAVAGAESDPVFRIVHPKALRERSADSEHDEGLRKLIRRAPSAGRGPRGGPGGGGRRGHSSATGHRTTGK